MHTFVADLRYGARLLRQSPGFTAMAIAALAIGIGANLTIFGFAKDLLLTAPRGIADPDRVARAYTNRFSNTSYPNYETYRDSNQTFVALAAFRPDSLNLRSEGSPEQLFGLSVSGNYFPALGVSASLGRAIAPSDDRAGAPPVVVLSDRSWRLRFGSSSAVLGQTLTINGRSHTIIGVAPPEFTGAMAPLLPDVWMPLAQSARTMISSVQMIGRLRPGVTIDQAEADLTRLASQLSPAAPDDRLRPTVTVYAARALAPEMALPAAIFAGLLLAVAGLVLLLACINIANLLLARSVGRAREIAVRLALGASRWRLVRQMLTESLLLSVLGSAGAAALASIAARPLTAAIASLPVGMPVGVEFIIDWRLLAFAMGLAAATALAFGLVPALQSSSPRRTPLLKEGAATSGPTRSRLRHLLVTSQVAISTLLLVLAVLLVRGLMSAHTLDRGFVTKGVLTASLNLASAGYTADRGVEFYERLRERLEQTPGIAAANVVDIVPLTLSNRAGGMTGDIEPGTNAPQSLLVYQNSVSPGHFRTLGIPLVAGRDFETRDGAHVTPVVIVNETLGRLWWPTGSPVGKRVRQRTGRESFGPWMEIVGVARDSKYVTVGEERRPFVYVPLAQAHSAQGTILVKSNDTALDALPRLRDALRTLDPNLALFNIMTLDEATSISLLPIKVAATLTAALGAVALVLGAIGLYGVMSYLVRQRTREIGIRMALGAQGATVIRLITGQGMYWTAIGLAVGLVAAFGIALLIRGFLYGVGPADPVAFVVITLLLTATAFAACYVPARRASRIDPLNALRDE